MKTERTPSYARLPSINPVERPALNSGPRLSGSAATLFCGCGTLIDGNRQCIGQGSPHLLLNSAKTKTKRPGTRCVASTIYPSQTVTMVKFPLSMSPSHTHTRWLRAMMRWSLSQRAHTTQVAHPLGRRLAGHHCCYRIDAIHMSQYFCRLVACAESLCSCLNAIFFFLDNTYYYVATDK